MAQEFKMPMVAESVVEGEIGRWLVKEGDFVKRDQPLVEVLTDKVNVEIPSPIEGHLLRIVAVEGKIAKVGDVIAVFGERGERLTDLPEASEPAGEKESAREPVPVPSPKPTQMSAAPPTPQVASTDEKSVEAIQKAMPAARRLAKDLGVDLSMVTPTGPDGIITEADVKSAAGKKPAPAPPVTHPVTHQPPSSPPKAERHAPIGREERIPFRGIRRSIAQAMVRSRQTAVSTLHVDEADVTDLVALREVEKRKASEKGIKLTYLPFFIKAVVAALKKFPEVNASLDEEAGEIVYKYYYNIGIATATEQGLVVPVIKNADKKDIWELASEITVLAEKARSGRLELSDVQDSTFSITNIGSLRGQISFPIINLPNAAIIGIQSITKRPVVRNGEVAIRDMVNLSVAFDHRILDGATASAFTTEIIRRLETPALLFWEEG